MGAAGGLSVRSGGSEPALRRFLDTNVLIYSVSKDARGVRAITVIRDGGLISVQVLNEFTHVARNKLRHPWPAIEAAITRFRIALGPVVSLTVETHAAALVRSRDHGFGIFDGLIVTSAIEAGCTELLTEDLQDGRVIDGLTIRNPFA